MGVSFGDTREERFPQDTGRLDLRRLEGPLPTASLVQRTEQLVYYHELQTQQKEAQLDRMLGHTGSATRPDQAVLDGRRLSWHRCRQEVD